MSTLEPGLLVVFRAFAVGLVALLVAVLGLFAVQDSPPHPILPVLTMLFPAVACVGVALWRGLVERLGRLFLPLCIGLATAIPFTGQLTALLIRAEDLSYFSAELSLTLSFPLLMVAWQYRFSAVLWFAAVTTALDLAMANLSLFGLGSKASEYHHVIITRVVILLAAGYIITRLMTAQRTQRDQLERANTRLANFAAAAERLAISHERNRIARELHDTVAHSLSGLTLTLEAMRTRWDADPVSVRQMLDTALETARSGMGETRRALEALRASPLETMGLVRALEELAQGEAQRAGAQLKLILPDGEPSLTMDAEQVCYRIAQEALENVIRHADAALIELALEVDGDRIELRVRDDGCGFQPNAVRDGRFGLRGMEERAMLLDGELTVNSEIGQGTEVIADFCNGNQKGRAS